MMKKSFFLLSSLFFTLYLFSCGGSKEDLHPALTNPFIYNSTKQIQKDPENAALYFERSDLLLQIEMDSLAILDLEKAVALDPKNMEYQYKLGIIYMDIQQPEKAIPLFQNALKEIKDYTPLNLLLTDAYIETNQLDLAKSTLNEIQAKENENPGILLIHSELALKEGDTALAEQQLIRLTEFFPDYDLGWVYLGDLYRENNDERLIEVFEKAYLIDTLNADPYFQIAQWYESNGEIDKAIEEYERVIRIDYDWTEAYMSLGKIYLSMDSLEKAYRHFDLASKTKINYGDAYYYQSLALERNGSYEIALKTINQALIYDSNNELYLELKEKLSKK